MKITYHEAKEQLSLIIDFLKNKYPDNNFFVSGDFLRKKELISELIIISDLLSYPDLETFNPVNIQKCNWKDFNGVPISEFEINMFLPFVIKLVKPDEIEWFIWKESSDVKHINKVFKKTIFRIL